MAIYLEPLNGGRQIVLDKAVVLIGRQGDCDAILTSSRKVSRRHCCIAQVNDHYRIRDLASMNGVRVNGELVDRESVIAVGDEISIGDVRYLLRDSSVHPPVVLVEKLNPAVEPLPLPLPPPVAPPRSVSPAKLPNDVSQQFPVPIAEEDGVDFAVESSPARRRPKEDEAEHSATSDEDNRDDEVDDDEDVPDAIILEDSDEYLESGSQR